MGYGYDQLKTDREARSSYGARHRTKTRKREPRAQMAADAEKVSQEERIRWARARYCEALHRSRDVGDSDPILLATVAGRKQELEREQLALARLREHALERKRHHQ
jgi:hypothetical protein